MEVKVNSHQQIVQWLTAHRNKKNNLVITLKRSSKVEKQSSRVLTEQERLRNALEYDISLGHKVIKSKMKASLGELGVRDCLVLKLDLLSEFVKEYLYEEVQSPNPPPEDVRALKFKLDQQRELLFSVESHVFKYLKKSVSGKTILEFDESAISFSEDQLFGTNKLVLDGPNLADYDYQRVFARLGRETIKISSNSLFDLIHFGRRFDLDRVSILLGEKVESGWHFHVVVRAEFCSVWLRFVGVDYFSKSEPRLIKPALGETVDRGPARTGPDFRDEPNVSQLSQPSGKGRLFRQSQARNGQSPWVGDPRLEPASQMPTRDALQSAGERLRNNSRKLLKILETETGSSNSQFTERPMAKIYTSPEIKNRKNDSQR